MTQQRLKLHIAKHIPDDPGIVGTRTVALRERIICKLLGRKQQVTIVVFGNSVKQIDISETNDDLTALTDATDASRGSGDDR